MSKAKNGKEQPPEVVEIPRRVDLERNVPEELAIREVTKQVEAMGADVRLTDAVVLLGQARDRVADFVDGVEPTPPVEEEPKVDLANELVVAKALLREGHSFVVAFHRRLPGNVAIDRWLEAAQRFAAE